MGTFAALRIGVPLLHMISRTCRCGLVGRYRPRFTSIFSSSALIFALRSCFVGSGLSMPLMAVTCSKKPTSSR